MRTRSQEEIILKMSFVWGREQKCEARVGRGMGVERVFVLFVFLNTRMGRPVSTALEGASSLRARGECRNAGMQECRSGTYKRLPGGGVQRARGRASWVLLWMQGFSATGERETSRAEGERETCSRILEGRNMNLLGGWRRVIVRPHCKLSCGHKLKARAINMGRRFSPTTFRCLGAGAG